MRREAKRWAVLGACLLAAVAAGCSDPADQLHSDDPAARIEAIRLRCSLRMIQAIFHHNALDLLTMAELSAHILEASA